MANEPKLPKAIYILADNASYMVLDDDCASAWESKAAAFEAGLPPDWDLDGRAENWILKYELVSTLKLVDVPGSEKERVVAVPV